MHATCPDCRCHFPYGQNRQLLRVASCALARNFPGTPPGQPTHRIPRSNSLYFPGGHQMQLLLPGSGWYVPFGHQEQTAAPRMRDHCPAAHARQLPRPASFANRPVSQAWHASWPLFGCARPLGHGTHFGTPDLVLTLFFRVNVPEGHITAHASPASVGARPAGQRAHRWSRMMWPALQRHDAWSCAGTAPPLQAPQCSSPACFDTWPAVQRRQSVCPWCGLKRPA